MASGSFFMSARAGVPNVYVYSADGDQLGRTADDERALTVGDGDDPGRKGRRRLRDRPRCREWQCHRAASRRLPAAGASATGASSSNVPAVARLFEGVHADISPDGRYLAYQAANESGPVEVDVWRFPRHAEARPVADSTRGGTRPGVGAERS